MQFWCKIGRIQVKGHAQTVQLPAYKIQHGTHPGVGREGKMLKIGGLLWRISWGRLATYKLSMIMQVCKVTQHFSNTGWGGEGRGGPICKRGNIGATAWDAANNNCKTLDRTLEIPPSLLQNVLAY